MGPRSWFDAGPSTVRRRASSSAQARGHRAAVFKAIKNGGTHTKGQLSNQLSYITRDHKLAHFVDSRGDVRWKDEVRGQGHQEDHGSFCRAVGQWFPAEDGQHDAHAHVFSERHEVGGRARHRVRCV